MERYNRNSAIDISQDDFRLIGHSLIDKIADFFEGIGARPVTTKSSQKEIKEQLGIFSLPENGQSPASLLSNTADLLMQHSLLNGHPKFMGYITSSPAPIGVLADMLAAAINPNVGAQILSPIATEIEKQTINWLCEFIGVPISFGGVLVSGGNMANLTAFRSAMTAMAPKEMKTEGIVTASSDMTIYCSKATHTWVEKAAVLFGLGTNSIRWIPLNVDNQMDIKILNQTIKNDIKNGLKPFIVVGTAGDVSTGSVDNLKEISNICKAQSLWFHVDGAYGVPAATIDEFKKLFAGLEEADSIAIDPHKWLYCPLEVGCTLIKNPKHLTDAYSAHPEYYNFEEHQEEKAHNFYEYGFQNSRGFRALKVWLALQQVGRSGYEKMIKQDIELSEFLYQLADEDEELEAMTQSLSITTFRYIPSGMDKENNETYLNTLNEQLLNVLQKEGEVFLSNSIVNDKYCLRSCIVNFRTSKKDIHEIIKIIIREGQKIHQVLN